MNINRHNYEAYLLDLLEGRLSVEDQQQLHDFLLFNPDCGGELSEQEPWLLEPAELHFPKKDLLKKEIPHASSLLTDYNFDLFSIARLEGDLTEEQEETHRKILSEDLQKYNQWKLWQQTKLEPEEVVFKNKQQLIRRKGPGRKFIWISLFSSAAAAILMVIVLLRMEPVLPLQELSVQADSQPLVQQDTELPDQAEAQAGVLSELPEPKEEQARQQKPVLPEQKTANAAMFNVKKEHNRPPETKAKMELESVDHLQSRPLRVSETKVNLSELAGNPVPDRIEPLKVPPVPIHLSSLSVAQLTTLDFQEVLEDYTDKKDISIWTIASAGINGINKIAGSDISLLASRDEEGDISGFRLKTKRFSLTRPLGRED